MLSVFFGGDNFILFFDIAFGLASRCCFMLVG